MKQDFDTIRWFIELLIKEKKIVYLWIFLLILIPLYLVMLFANKLPNDTAIYLPFYVGTLTLIMLGYLIYKTPKTGFFTLFASVVLIGTIYFNTNGRSLKMIIDYFTN